MASVELSDFERQLCENNFYFFVKLILKWKVVGKMHLDIIDSIQNTDKHVVVVAARGHWKTSLLSKAFPLWIMYKEKRPMDILSLSASKDMPGEIMGGIKDEIEKNPTLRSLMYPENVYDTAWSVGKIKTANGHIFRANMFGSSNRGPHPDYIICDDILRDEDANIPFAKERFWSQIYPMTIAPPDKKIFTKKTRIIIVGTPISFTDLLMDDVDGGGLNGSEEFIRKEYPAVITNEDGDWLSPQFPEFFSLEELKKRKRNMPAHLWSREYMCRPISSETSLFPYELLRECVNLPYPDLSPEEELMISYYGGHDVALSESKTADYAAYAVVQHVPDRPYRVVDATRLPKGTPTDKQKDKILQLHEQYHFRTYQLEKTGLSEGMAMEMEQMPECRGWLIPFDTKKTSRERILSQLEILMRSKQIKLPNDPLLLEELQSFGLKREANGRLTYRFLGKHDDIAMAVAIAIDAAYAAPNVVSLEFVGPTEPTIPTTFYDY